MYYTIIIIIALLSFSTKTNADIYEFEDSQGAIHMTDQNCPGYKKTNNSNKQPNGLIVHNKNSFYIAVPFKKLTSAESFKNSLRANNIEAFIFSKSKTNILVWFGFYETRKKAAEAANMLVDTGVLKKFIISSPEEDLQSQPQIVSAKRSANNEVKRMERVLNSNSRKFGYKAKCKSSDQSPEGDETICHLQFVGNYSIGRVPFRFVHQVENITRNFAVAFSRAREPRPFTLQSTVSVEGNQAPIYIISYSKHFDSLTTIYQVK